MPAQQKQQSSLFPSNGPSTPRAAGTNSLICLWEQSCASNDRPAINRFSVSRLSPRQPHDPKVFPRSASTSSRRKGTIKQICSRSPSATCPRSSVSRERCTNVWFKKTVPRSLPSLYSQVGLHSSASPSRPASKGRRYPPGPSIQADPVAAAPHASLRASRLLAGASDESVADIGFLFPIPPPWPQVLFRVDNSSSFLSHPNDKETLQTARPPSIVVDKHQALGPAKHTSFATPRLPATFTASLQTLPSTGCPSG